MTRIGKYALGVIGLLAVGGAVCNGQGQTKGRSVAAVPYDTEVALTSDGKTITATPPIAIVSRGSGTPFKWVVGSLPDGSTLEIDIRVQGTRKGPFARTEAGPQGRYVGRSGQSLPAGALQGAGREIWKYDVVLRDRDGNNVTAVDPAIIIME
jgi:hypothetical protein